MHYSNVDRRCCFRADILHQMVFTCVCEMRVGNILVFGEVGIESSNTWLLVAWDSDMSPRILNFVC
jgi:hypothetical protein